ncbi:MAG: NAD(P)/FAD-dependent oxidoreductase [Armatimonadota bacterium]
MSRTVVVLGGGVIGLCCALHLSRSGWNVVVVERGRPDHDGCSLGNAGMVVPSHFVPLAAPGMVGYGLRRMWNPESPFALRPRLDAELLDWGLRFLRSCTREHVDRSVDLLRDLNLRSRTLFEELSTTLDDDFGLVRRGLLMLCRTRHALDEETRFAERSRSLGVPAEVVQPDRLAELDPDVEMSAAGGVYFPKDCHLSPRRFVAAVKRELERSGARFVWEAEATGWERAGDRIRAVRTRQGDLGGDAFVVAGGAWSSALARGLGLRLPLQGGKGYSMTLPNPPRTPRLCSILVEARVAVTPMPEGLRIGGTMEIVGKDLRVDPRRVEGIRKSVPAYFPAFDRESLRGVPVWSGLRPCSPDGLPYVGSVPGCSNVRIATGHAMMGLSLAPVTGELVAADLDGRTTDIDIQRLAPARHG